jgi:hypothetical protein
MKRRVATSIRKHVAQASLSKLALVIPAACIALGASTALSQSPQRVQFLAFDNTRSFTRFRSTDNIILTSPEIRTRINFDELIASWNVQLPPTVALEIQARPIYNPSKAALDGPARFYTMGIWTGDPKVAPRQSVLNQKDEIGKVSTDTLKLSMPANGVQLRLILTGADAAKARLKFLGICLTDTRIESNSELPDKAAWDKLILVPERSQMKYENGNVLCSPTTISMLLAYWSEQLHQPDLDHDVPEVARQVYDPNWEGTGNWPFNTAFAGSFEPLRAYVTRLSLPELEAWIAHGFPAGLSVCYNKLRGKIGPFSGHLVVCVGFNKDGDPIINDPGTSRNVRKTFTRENLIAAWACSKNTVYLVYPKNAKPPKDEFGHWDSPKSRRIAGW